MKRVRSVVRSDLPGVSQAGRCYLSCADIRPDERLKDLVCDRNRGFFFSQEREDCLDISGDCADERASGRLRLGVFKLLDQLSRELLTGEGPGRLASGGGGR